MDYVRLCERILGPSWLQSSFATSSSASAFAAPSTLQSGPSHSFFNDSARKRRQVAPQFLKNDEKNIKRRHARAITAALNEAGVTRERGRPGGPSTPTTLKRQQSYCEKKKAEHASECLNQPESELVAVLSTRAGQRQFPQLAKTLQIDPAKDAVFDAAIDLVKAAGRSAKPILIRKLAGSLTARQAAQVFKMSHTVVKNIFLHERADDEKTHPQNTLLQMNYPPNVSRHKLHPCESAICVKFFQDKCASSTSYARESATLFMHTTYHQMEKEFYAHFPALLLAACRDDPSLIAEARKSPKPTRFEKAVIAVCDPRKTFSYDDRLKIAEQRYCAKLKQCAERLRQVSRVKPDSKDQPVVSPENLGMADDSEDEIDDDEEVRPMCQRAFLQALKDAGVKYTTKSYPHACPLHSKGRVYFELALTKAQKAEADMLQRQQELPSGESFSHTDNVLLENFRQATQHATKALDAFDRHIRQFEHCRKYVNELENALKQGECVVYRDFVSQYLFGTDFLGEKMNNLQLVLVFKDSNDVLRSLKVANFCGDKKTLAHDAWYVADVFQFHMGEEADEDSPANPPKFSGLFRNFHTLYLVGDHGPHFSSKQTIYNESFMQTKYRKTIYSVFLCSYHAYSRADGAGNEVKRLALEAAKERAWWNTSQDFAAGISRSNYHNSIGYCFPKINRSENVFPKKLQGKDLGLRDFCDFKYVTNEIGVIFYRELPSFVRNDNYYVVDLCPRPSNQSDYLCPSCSNCLQQVCRHKISECKSAMSAERTSHVVKNLKLNAQVSSQRFEGPQVGGQKHQEKGVFPCRVAGCTTGWHYKDAKASNKHMVKEHLAIVRATGEVLYTPCEIEVIKGVKKGLGPFPCKFPGCIYNWYSTAATSNSHMQSAHSPCPELYSTKKALKKAGTRNRKLSTSDSESESDVLELTDASEYTAEEDDAEDTLSEKDEQHGEEGDEVMNDVHEGIVLEVGDRMKTHGTKEEDAGSPQTFPAMSPVAFWARKMSEGISSPNVEPYPSSKSSSPSHTSSSFSSAVSSAHNHNLSQTESLRLLSPYKSASSSSTFCIASSSNHKVQTLQTSVEVSSSFSSFGTALTASLTTSSSSACAPPPSSLFEVQAISSAVGETPGDTSMSSDACAQQTTLTECKDISSGGSRSHAQVSSSWAHPAESLVKIRKGDIVFIQDEHLSWWIGEVLANVQEGNDSVSVWEYGSENWRDPLPGSRPPKDLKWLPRYSNKEKDLYLSRSNFLSQEEANQGFIKVQKRQPLHCVMLWGKGKDVLYNGFVKKKYWDLIHSPPFFS